MSKVMLALGSFIFGASVMFLILSGNHTSTLAHAAAPGVALPKDLIPVVPALRGTSLKDAHVDNVVQQLDGLECERCSFNNAALEYSGGPVRLANMSVSGNTRLKLKGAAANTIVVVTYFQAIAAGQPVKPVVPRNPITRVANVKDTFKGDFATPW